MTGRFLGLFLLAVWGVFGLGGVVWAQEGKTTITMVMETAAHRSIPAKIVGEGVAMAEATRRVAFAGLLPRLVASGQVTRNPEAITLEGRSVVQLWDYNANATLSIDLFRGTALGEWMASGAAVDAAEMDARWKRAGLRLAAARAFLAVLAAERNVDAIELTLQQREATLREAETRLQTGFGIRADVEKARLSVLDAKSDQLDVVRVLHDARAELAWVTGVEITEAGALDPTIPEFETPDERADIAALRLLQLVTERTIDGQWLDFIPILSMVGRAEFGEESLRAPDGVSWTLTFQATWPLYEPSRYGRLDQLAAEARRLDLETADRVLTMKHTIDLAARAVDTALQKVKVAKEKLVVSEDVQTQVQNRFRQGLITALEVTDADVVVFRSRVGLNIAQLEVDLARIELAWAKGAFDG